jgi:uncharacterized protein YbjT (DUF2867 family)
MKKVFVTSITGTQGASIARVFKDQGYTVASMVRKSVELPEYSVVEGSFSNTPLLASLMKGSEAIILTLPLLFDAQAIIEITQQIVAATKAAGVQTILFNSSIPLGDSKTGYPAIDVKHDALDVLNKSGLDIITLMPTIYLDNLSSPFLLPIIQESRVIPYPISDDLEFNWISHENLGRYCVAALKETNLFNEKVLITNKGSYSKLDIAKLISDEVNTEVNYIPTTPAQFEDNLKPILGDYIANEIANLYRGVSENSENFINYTHQSFIDSVELESTENWVKSVAW